MRIWVTGCNGFLGSLFCHIAREGKDQVLGTLRSPQFVLEGCETKILDIRDFNASLEIGKAFKPDAIIHCARYTVGVGEGERDREATFQINAMGTRNLAHCAERIGAVFVYFSTDWIFNGRKPIGEKYKEDEDPCPLSYYGFTKLAGEQEVAMTKGQWLILRPANIYGVHALFLDPSVRKGKELMTRTSWTHKMAAKIEQGEKIGLPDSLYQSPILANHLVEVTLRLLKEGKTGIFHVAGRDGVSRYQFMRSLAERFGFDPDLVIRTSLKDLEKSWDVPEGLTGTLPENVCLDVGKVEKILVINMMTLSDGLSKMKDYFFRAK